MNISNLANQINLEGESNCPFTEMQHTEEQDIHDGSMLSQEFDCFNPGVTAEGSYDLGFDFGIGRKDLSSHDEQLSGEMLDWEYRKLVKYLNRKQKEFFNHIIHLAKTSKKPFYNFLTGETGKSVLLKALFQALLEFYSHKPGKTLTSTRF